MTLFNNPQGRGQQRYNTAQMTGRCTVERALGICRMRFRCLHKSSDYLGYTPKRYIHIIGAYFVLHDICRSHNIPYYEDDDDDDDDDDCCMDIYLQGLTCVLCHVI